jgi:putative transposase
MDRVDDGRPIKMLTLIDEFTKESLAICPARRIRSNDVIDIFADEVIERGVPESIRGENGPEMVVRRIRQWRARVGAQKIYIAPGGPWENATRELQRQAAKRAAQLWLFYALREAQVVIAQWRQSAPLWTCLKRAGEWPQLREQSRRSLATTSHATPEYYSD